jgi:iron complex outermembrane receptor protein
MNLLLPALRPTPVALALAMALGASAFARASDGDTALTLGQVVVSGTAAGRWRRRVLTSVDILPTERIESQVVNNNWELFGQVPGSC